MGVGTVAAAVNRIMDAHGEGGGWQVCGGVSSSRHKHRAHHQNHTQTTEGCEAANVCSVMTARAIDRVRGVLVLNRVLVFLLRFSVFIFC